MVTYCVQTAEAHHLGDIQRTSEIIAFCFSTFWILHFYLYYVHNNIIEPDFSQTAYLELVSFV